MALVIFSLFYVILSVYGRMLVCWQLDLRSSYTCNTPVQVYAGYVNDVVIVDIIFTSSSHWPRLEVYYLFENMSVKTTHNINAVSFMCGFYSSENPRATLLTRVKHSFAVVLIYKHRYELLVVSKIILTTHKWYTVQLNSLSEVQ